MAVDVPETLCCESPVIPYEEDGDDGSSERSSSPGRSGDSTISSAPTTGASSRNGTTGGEEAEPLSRMDSEDRWGYYRETPPTPHPHQKGGNREHIEGDSAPSNAARGAGGV